MEVNNSVLMVENLTFLVEEVVVVSSLSMLLVLAVVVADAVDAVEHEDVDRRNDSLLVRNSSLQNVADNRSWLRLKQTSIVISEGGMV